MTNNAIVAALLRATGGISLPASSSDGEGCSGAGMEAVSAALPRATLNISLLASSGGGEGHSAAGLEAVIKYLWGFADVDMDFFLLSQSFITQLRWKIASPFFSWSDVGFSFCTQGIFCDRNTHFLCPETPQRLDTKKISTNSYFLWR